MEKEKMNKSKCTQIDKNKTPKNSVCVSKTFTATRNTPRTVEGWKKIASDPSKLRKVGITKTTYNAIKNKASGKQLVKKLRSEVAAAKAKKEGYIPTKIRGNHLRIAGDNGQIEAHKYRPIKKSDSINIVKRKLSAHEVSRGVLTKAFKDMSTGKKNGKFKLDTKYLGSNGNELKKQIVGKRMKKMKKIKEQIEHEYAPIYNANGDINKVKKRNDVFSRAKTPIEIYAKTLKNEGLLDESFGVTINKFGRFK